MEKNMIKEKRFFPKQSLNTQQKRFVERKISKVLSTQPHVLFAYLFGSFLKGGPFRDIDVSLYMRDKYGFEAEYALSSLLSEALELEVEVKILNNAPVYIQGRVLNEGKLLFSRDEDKRIQFIEKVSRKYREYVHFRNIYLGIEGKTEYASDQRG